MESELLRLGVDRVLIEDGISYRLSLTAPDTEAKVSIINYDYPGSGWDHLSGRTITYFKYQLDSDDLYLVNTDKISTGETIKFHTLCYSNVANESCEYQFAFIDARCIARSPSYLAKESHTFISQWQTKVIEDRCTVVKE